jgi:hypothetical protein
VRYQTPVPRSFSHHEPIYPAETSADKLPVLLSGRVLLGEHIFKNPTIKRGKSRGQWPKMQKFFEKAGTMGLLASVLLVNRLTKAWFGGAIDWRGA